MSFSAAVRNRLIRKFALGIGCALLAVTLKALLFDTSLVDQLLGLNVFQAIELRGYDALMRLRGTRSMADDVVLIGADEATCYRLGWPIRRDYVATVVAALESNGAKAVALDIFEPNFAEDEDDNQNQQMVRQLRGARHFFQIIGPKILSSTEAFDPSDVDSAFHNVFGRFGLPTSGIRTFWRSPFIADAPFDESATVTTGVGHAILAPDTIDGIIRKMPLFVEYAGQLYPSLGLAVALHTMDVPPRRVRCSVSADGVVIDVGRYEISANPRGEVLINYPVRANQFATVSFYRVLRAVKEEDFLFLRRFNDKVCFIGPTSRGLGDYYPTPLDNPAPGYAIHASLYTTIAQGKLLQPAATWMSWLLTLLSSVLIGVMVLTRSIQEALGFWVGTVSVVIALSLVAYSELDLWIPYVGILFALSTCLVFGFVYQASTEGRQRRRITEIFGRYIDKAVVRALLEDPSLVEARGEKREVTILFADVPEFMSLSSILSERDFVKFTNQYLSAMAKAIERTGGVVDKFVGHTVMAFWSEPIVKSAASGRALSTAIEMLTRFARFRRGVQELRDTAMSLRIGINTGFCTVGNIGSEKRLSYTVIGDAVNTASRLQRANDVYGTNLLLTEHTKARLAKEVVLREVDHVVLVGKSDVIRIYDMVSPTSKSIAHKRMRSLDFYYQGLRAYQAGRWNEGIAYMTAALDLIPNDPVCRTYIDRMNLFQYNPPELDWDGVFRLTIK